MRYRTTDGNAAAATLNSIWSQPAGLWWQSLEQYQLEDGRVKVPDCSVERMGGKTHLNRVDGEEMYAVISPAKKLNCSGWNRDLDFF